MLSQYLDARFAMRLLATVATVGAGGSYVDRDIVAALMRHRTGSGVLAELSSRELDILALMAEGRSNLGISQRLYLSPKTVETHVRSIFLKLDPPPTGDDHRRVIAVLRYLQARDATSVREQ